MKTLQCFLLSIGLAVLAVLAYTPAASAACIVLPNTSPVCMTRTTLSANASETATVLTVTSGTGFTAGNGLWIDYEQMLIRAVSSTSITVSRGQNGTRAVAHDNGDGVFTGVNTGGPRGGGHFNAVDPPFGQDCTRGTGDASHLPWINVRTGWMWTCDVGTDWTASLKPTLTVDSEPSDF